MSDATISTTDHADGHAHPTDKLFVKTAIILTLITAAEVAWSYLPIWDGATGAKSLFEIGGLLIMMFAKFFIVASVFMHLKYDKPILSRAFYFGFVIAILVYTAALATFEIFSSGKPGYLP